MRSAIRVGVLVIAAALAGTGCTMLRGEQSPGAYVDDSALTARVKAALLDSEEVKGTQINVDAYNGQITLSGNVDDEQTKRRAEEIARQVPGVKSVQSTIRVAEAPEASSTEAENEGEPR